MFGGDFPAQVDELLMIQRALGSVYQAGADPVVQLTDAVIMIDTWPATTSPMALTPSRRRSFMIEALPLERFARVLVETTRTHYG